MNNTSKYPEIKVNGIRIKLAKKTNLPKKTIVTWKGRRVLVKSKNSLNLSAMLDVPKKST